MIVRKQTFVRWPPEEFVTYLEKRHLNAQVGYRRGLGKGSRLRRLAPSEGGRPGEEDNGPTALRHARGGVGGGDWLSALWGAARPGQPRAPVPAPLLASIAGTRFGSGSLPYAGGGNPGCWPTALQGRQEVAARTTRGVPDLQVPGIALLDSGNTHRRWSPPPARLSHLPAVQPSGATELSGMSGVGSMPLWGDTAFTSPRHRRARILGSTAPQCARR